MSGDDLLTPSDRERARQVGVAAAEHGFDYTASDDGWARVVELTRRILRVPLRYPGFTTAADAATYKSWVARARKSRRINTSLVAGGVLVVVIPAVVSYGGSSIGSILVPLLALVVVGVVYRSCEDPAKVPHPPVQPDGRQALLTRAYTDHAIQTARERTRQLAKGARRSARPTGETPLTPVAAEHKAGEWMRFLGANDVQVSQATRDGGIDVAANGFVAQVKWQDTAVSPAPVHQIFGVAQSRTERAIFFAAPAGYSRDAIRFADSAGVALFVMTPTGDSIAGANSPARTALQRGLPALWGA